MIEAEIVTLLLREPEAEEIRNILIFSGALVCAECGGVYSHIQPSHKKERYGIPKWKCKNIICMR